MLPKTQQQKILKIPIDAETLSLLEQARAYLDWDKTLFIRQSILEKSKSVISSHQQTYFNQYDWQTFFALIENPPPITERMKKAALRYQTIIDGNEV